MENCGRFFQKGDFITYSNKPGSFVIYEGLDLGSTSTYYKKMSVIANYDPNKYREHEDGGYRTSPFLEVATKSTRCEKTISDVCETYWLRLCTEDEKKRAIEKLHEYGYDWNEELLSIVDMETGEIIRRIIEPKIEYNGNIIKPITEKLKKLLLSFCKESVKSKYSYQNAGPYGRYWDEYGDYYFD